MSSIERAGARYAGRRGRYGIDAPSVPLFMGLSGLLLFTIGLYLFRSGESLAGAIVCLYWALWMLAATGSYLYTTRRGKFAVWSELLNQLQLRGDERVLDLGCGRGAVLILAAKHLPRGKAVGIDLWSASDQSGNRLEAAQHNVEIEGVAERVELHTGDMRELPFPDQSFDVVLSSLAIHNIRGRADRQRAIDEAVRVLKPRGKLLIADFRATSEYANRLRELGVAEVSVRGLGPRFWYGGPWTATRLVSARR
jgi:arsenite methyltransferase